VTEYYARLKGTFLVGERIGRVRCASNNGGIIAWIMRKEDGSIALNHPPTKPGRRGKQEELIMHT